LHYLEQEDHDWGQVEDLAIRLKSQGMQPPFMDLVIAVVAHRHKAQLLHYGDKHFAVIGAVLPVKIIDLKLQRGS
jgi:predicted nucleic acid-binding protein